MSEHHMLKVHAQEQQDSHKAGGVCMRTDCNCRKSPNMPDGIKIYCSVPPPTSGPPVRGTGQEGWQTSVLAPRGMPGEVRITHSEQK